MRKLHKEIHVWSSQLDQPREVVDQCRSILGEQERRRVDRFKTARLRSQHTVAKASFISLIASYAGKNPGQIHLRGDERHKPFLDTDDGSDFQFSLSHCNNLAICGFSGDGSIGVDVEEIDAGRDWEHIIDVSLSDYEKDWFLRRPRERRVAHCIEIWTIKEAYLKAIGTGLSVPPTAVELEWNVATGYQFRSSHEGHDLRTDWSIFTFSPATGFTSAVVMQGKAREVLRFTWVPELLN